MNLAEAAFEMIYPGMFRIQQLIIYACFAAEHCWLGEIFCTLLGQGYTHKAGGFSHFPAGNSNSGSYRKVSQQQWDMFLGRAVQAQYLERLSRATEQAVILRDRIRDESLRVQAQEEYQLGMGVLEDCVTSLEKLVDGMML